MAEPAKKPFPPAAPRDRLVRFLNRGISRLIRASELSAIVVVKWLSLRSNRLMRFLVRYGYGQFLMYSFVFMVVFYLACRALGGRANIPEAPPTSQQVLAETMATAVTRVNNSGSDKTFELKDGSRITLSTGGSISYPRSFGETKRIVTLAGNAFFKIAASGRSPFVVHSGTTVIATEGASFHERSVNKDTIITISIESGKVTAYRAEDFDNIEMEGLKKTQNLELEAKEKAVFSKARRLWNKK